MFEDVPKLTAKLLLTPMTYSESTVMYYTFFFVALGSPDMVTVH